jgi:hypothetical protein
MKYAKRERMPIDESKVKDLLRNQHIFRYQFKKDIGTYQNEQEKTSFENGLLTYVNEAAWGDLRELLKDIGINKQTIQFSNVADLLAREDKNIFESQANFRNLANARFTMVDMTDYDYNFSGPDEVGGQL